MKPTQEQVIAWAREAGFESHDAIINYPKELQRFAAIVAAAERERLKWDGLHSCHSECDRPACVHTRKAVEAEREACAKVAERFEPIEKQGYVEYASTAIRARGQG